MRVAAGFTLIELLVTIAVLGLLLALGVPTLRGVLENGRIRAAAESWKYGLTLARTEAVRRNVRVGFFVTADGWQVGTVDANGNLGTVFQEGAGGEGTAGVAVTVDPVGSSLVTFDPLGRLIDPNPGGTDPFGQLDFASSNPPTTNGYKPLRIQMLAGGLSRLCDPALPATDPRACL